MGFWKYLALGYAAKKLLSPPKPRPVTLRLSLRVVDDEDGLDVDENEEDEEDQEDSLPE